MASTASSVKSFHLSASVIVHPSYDPDTLSHDMALLELPMDIDFRKEDMHMSSPLSLSAVQYYQFLHAVPYAVRCSVRNRT